MKIKGKVIKGVNRDILVIPRPDGNIVFTAEAIQSWAEFDELCPLPTPPTVMLPGGAQQPDTSAPGYRKKLQEWGENKTNYMVLKSLSATEGLEWDTVDLQKPETWKNWRTELETSGFIEAEVVRILRLCSCVNAVSEEMMDRAREAFLLEARQQGN